MATEEKVIHRLEELRESGFEIVDDQLDIIGWKVKARSGKKIGKIKDMLFEPRSRKVRYLVVDLDDNELNLEQDRKVLIPIGMAELYAKGNRERKDADPAFDAYDPTWDGNVVFLPTITAAQLDALPLYEKNHLSPHVEMAIRNILESTGNGRHDNDEFYRHEHFDDERFYHHKVK